MLVLIDHINAFMKPNVKKLIKKVAGTQKGKQKSTIRHMEAGVRRSNRTIHYSYLHYNLDNLYNYAEQK